MTTASENPVTNSAGEPLEVLDDAAAEAAFAEAAAALSGEQPAETPEDLDEDAGAAPTPDEDEGAATAGEGQAGDQPEDQSGGGEGEAAVAAEPGEGDEGPLDLEALKAALEAAEQRADKAEQQFRSREGRERALQRDLERARAGGTGEQPQPRKPLKELLETDQIKAIRDEYPDFVPLIDLLSEVGNRADGALEEVGQVKTGVVAQAITAEETKLNAALPNWQELAGHPEFQKWVDDRPKADRDIVADNWDAIIDADAVKNVFETFRDTVVSPKVDPAPSGEEAGGKRKRQASSAQAAKVNGPAAASGESDDPEVLFAQAAAKKDRERGIR